MTPNLEGYGYNPWDDNADQQLEGGGMGGAAAPMKANQWLRILKRASQNQQPQQGGQQQSWNPVQTYNSLGGIGGDLYKIFAGANGGVVRGPTPSLIGEADPEMLQHQDGSQELISSPQVRMLGTNGTDTIRPLTPPPHHTSSAGKKLISRLKVKHRFADGGTVDGYDDNDTFTTASISDALMDSPPELTSPEPRDPMAGTALIQPASNLGKQPLSVRDQIATLKLPVRDKPSILRRLAAAGIGAAGGYVNAAGRMRHPIDMTAAEDAIKYPGYGQQVQDYTRQRADLQNQLQQQQGTTADQQAQATLAHTQAQTDLSRKQNENFGYQGLTQMLEHGGQLEEGGVHLTSPEGHAGSHIPAPGMPGKTVYMPTTGETEGAKKRADQVNWLDVPKPLQAMPYGLPPKAPYQAIDSALRVMEQQGRAKDANDLRRQLADQAEQGRNDRAADTNNIRAMLGAVAAGNRSDKADTSLRSTAIKTYQPAMDSAERFNVMAQNYEDAIKDHDQQAMLSLLANHLGMTMGLQKGSRLTKDIINEAKVSRPWLQGMLSKFDKDGYLSGVTLSPAQMRQMVSLGQGRFSQDISKSRNEARYLGIKDDGPERTPSKATINYYTALAGGDPNKAKALATADGWNVK